MLNNEFPPLGGGTGTVNRAVLQRLARVPGLEVDLLTSALGRRYESERLAERVRLRPFSPAEAADLVRELTGAPAAPAVVEAIHRKTEGNPFFVEEVIRTLIERGALVQEGAHWAAGKDLAQVEIPDNLHGLLLARIDRLPDDVKRTLRAAAVIGRQFPLNVLQQVLEA